MAYSVARMRHRFSISRQRGRMPNRLNAAYDTPTQLQQHGVRADLGTAMLPRGWMSYKDQETKKYLLRVAWILPASKAIPRPGDPSKWSKSQGASQLLLGMMLGQDRSTTNRDLRLFCGDDAQVAPFFNKQRPGIGVVNRYSERKQPEMEHDKKKVLLQYDPAKLAGRYGAEYFDVEMEGVSGCGPVALWTFDENLPKPIRCGCRKGQMRFNFSSRCMKCGGKGYTLDQERKMGPSARTVLAVLQLQGIVSFGFRDITCHDLGKLAGLHEDTVAECLDELEDLKILQIVPGKVTTDRTGAVIHRDPQRLIWLPGLLLDHTIVERERQRFAAHLKDTRERAQLNGWAAAGIHLDRIAALHNELLGRWMMSRHSLGAFWTAMRKLIYMERIPCGRMTNDRHDYREYLFPVHLE